MREAVHVLDGVVVPVAVPALDLPVVQHHVHRQAVQPGAERALTAELRELVPCTHEDVLCQLLGAAPVGDHACAQGKDAVDMCAVDPFERAPVAALRERDIVGRVLQGCVHGLVSSGRLHRVTVPRVLTG